MLGAFRSADAGPRGAAARIGLAALLACIGLTWTAGATSAFATYGTVKITKVNDGGDPADSFHFNASTAIKSTGGFDLKGGGSYSSSTVHANAGAYNGAAYNVSEPANDKYELKSLVCSVTAANYKPTYGSATTDVANRAVAIKVGVGEKVECTFTNQRKTGTITVKKALVPATDTGKFDLQVDGKNVATQVGNNGYGTTTVTTGTHTVGEAGANLGDYVSYTSCKNASGYEVVKGSGVVNVPVASKDAITCTITNTRKTGTIKVVKNLKPSTDEGRFDLQVDGQTVKAMAGDGGYGSASVPTGMHTVGEVAANTASLGDYTRSTSCTKPNGYVVAGGPGTVNVTVGADDQITCTITNVRNATIVIAKHTIPADTAADKTQFGFTMDPGAIAYNLTDGGSDTRTVEPGKTYTIAETDPHAKGYKLTAIECSSGTGNVAYRAATVTPAAGETVTCSYTNTKLQPGIKIVKSGPAKAYSGDTLDFGFDVTNTGERALTDIDVRDDHCSPVVGPVSKADGDNGNDVLDPGETWHYTCSYVATHTLGDPNPVTNIATAQGTDDEGTKVEDNDSHNTLFLHPAIDITKSGPATATAGALLTYTLDVKNPGDMPFASADVHVTDAKCKAAPVLKSTNGDETPDALNPGDDWTYTCQVQSAVGQTSVVNVADATGADEYGKTVSDEDTFTTKLTQPTPPSTPQPPSTPTPTPQPAPAQAVAGVKAAARPARGTAALQGPRACPRTTSVSASVRGRQIRRVTFFVRGHKVKTVTKAQDGRWTLTVRTASLRRGANAVTARVEFAKASQTKTRTLRITITRCAAQVVQPQFTG